MVGEQHNSGESVSPSFDARRDGAGEWRLFLLAGRLFVQHGGFFYCCVVAGFGLFLAGLLLVGFRGFVTHNFNFDPAIDLPAACEFRRWQTYHAPCCSGCKWQGLARRSSNADFFPDNGSCCVTTEECGWAPKGRARIPVLPAEAGVPRAFTTPPAHSNILAEICCYLAENSQAVAVC
jgi:hypothetical protein